MRRPLVVVGDTVLDRDVAGDVDRLCPDAPVPVVDERASTLRPGGAGLAAAVLRADGRPVRLVTAIADDEAGGELRALLENLGIEVVALALHGATPEKVRIRSEGRTLLRVDRGGGRLALEPSGESADEAISGAGALLVSDYGNGVTSDGGIRDALAIAAATRPVVWDPHPRGAVPVRGCRLLTPNRREAERFAGGADDRPWGDGAAGAGSGGDGLAADIARARRLRERWAAGGLAVTLGGDGALVIDPSGTTLRVPAPVTLPAGTDTCGAGDRFAATAAAALADGGLLSDAVIAAVASASEFVRAGAAASALNGGASAGPGGGASAGVGGGAGQTEQQDALAVARRVRERRGVVVATGGCFDVLHAGHVRMLETARGLGDCLIACLNSDASIRARKGPGRPVVPEEDRAAVLRGLRCVDEVAVFSEPTPERLLADLRPDVWVKGADYTLADLPEADTVASWGGETVVLPYLEGRSTTALLKEAARDA